MSDHEQRHPRAFARPCADREPLDDFARRLDHLGVNFRTVASRAAALSYHSVASVATRRWTGRLLTLVAAVWFGLGIASAAAPPVEFLVAEDDGDVVDVLDQNGKWTGGGFRLSTDFDRGDAFVAGDIDGDGITEILVVEDSGDIVDVHKRQGMGEEVRWERAFKLEADFDSGDGLAVGDINGDGRDEILVVEDSGDVVDVLDGYGRRTDGFRLMADFDSGDGFAIGDLNGDGWGEILVAEDYMEMIEVLDQNGRLIDRFWLRGAVFGAGTTFAVGDVNGDGLAEILIVETIEDVVDVSDQNGNWTRRLQLVSDFDSGDGFAVLD